jgi:hypothetical protein
LIQQTEEMGDDFGALEKDFLSREVEQHSMMWL